MFPEIRTYRTGIPILGIKIFSGSNLGFSCFGETTRVFEGLLLTYDGASRKVLDGDKPVNQGSGYIKVNITSPQLPHN